MSSSEGLIQEHLLSFCCLLSLSGSFALAKPMPETAAPDDQYVLGPDSQPHAGVPHGKIFEFIFDRSEVFPSTSRTVTVYVPQQYKADGPACVYIGLDAIVTPPAQGDLQLPVVFDNLISKHDMPVTIAIGVSAGALDSVSPSDDPRFNRSVEFDTLDDSLARSLIDEILPEVERRRTPDGLPIRLSKNPNDRAVGGFSSGAIGAFTLAWERPEAFHRVFTAIGTFVGMRGGDRYGVLIRKTEPKPIRIFMQDGINDEWLGGPEVGDWWLGNQTVERALEFAGYQVEHRWGQGSHSIRHASAIFPDAMRWLWKGWPQPVEAGESQNAFLKEILLRGEGWTAVSSLNQDASILAAYRRGDPPLQDTLRISTSENVNAQLSEFGTIQQLYANLAFSADGRVYLIDREKGRIMTYNAVGKSWTAVNDVRASNLVVASSGSLYVTEPGNGAATSGKVWAIRQDGGKTLLDADLKEPTGIALSPDGLWLAVAEKKSHWGYSYRVQPDGTVRDKQRFYWFHVPDEADDSGVTAWVSDRDGRLYAATRMGVQVFDRNGRVRAILPVPGGHVNGIAFGGVDFGTLYIGSADNKVYRRKLNVRGMVPGAPPIQLISWGPG